ncbi:protein mono-ADP-ribosyltransferase PARP14-like isoform X2 [Tympanuchus pallidicinctus]|uniref:protein mono-ADP-ribosyltransferase PARP14-like isoform X2 n=1 Tax=Tympanuchus pallidicinctus TaxID=109042 RepID=UPI0022875EEE|nr:protein mono-ADP-ribosyltransferase PARP14-like isoform X2 [Tympanuchus pallidicinctus]
MAGPRPGSFPLLVRGDWGTAEPPAALRKKLLLYFQSPKRSGGGECELRGGPGQLLVCFAQPDVMRRVLDRPAHELEWGPRGKLSLLVTAPPQEGARSPQQPPAEPETPAAESALLSAADEPVPSVPALAEHDAAAAAGSGLSPQRPPPQEAPPEGHGAQEASQWEHPSAEKTELVVEPGQMEAAPEPWQMESSEASLRSPLIVLENVRETISSFMLTMLVENISDLSEEDGDFTVEMIPELRAAVVAFTGNAATADIVKKLNRSERAKKQNLSARLLELTNCIRAENIPPNTPSDYITIYFENKKNGGAQVMDVLQLCDEGAAIITFKNHQDVSNVLSKQHSLSKRPISVYPYYVSLGTALYGKEGPQIKKPDPVTVPLDPYIWQFLRRKNSLIEAICSEMANCHCEIEWPKGNCAEPKVILHPSAALSERKRSVAQLIRTWNVVASTTFSYSISKYKVEKLKVSAEVWEVIRTSINHNELLMISHLSKDLLVVIGHKDILKNVVRELKLQIEKVTREIEREKQTTEEIVILSPGDFAILQNIGLEERIRVEFPTLQLTYDHLQKIINLYGLREEVYKVKGEILVNMQKMAKKNVTLHPFVFQFLQRIDNETLSQSLFLSKHISAFYELGPDAVLLKGNDDETLLKAEEELKKELDYKSITLEDESILQKEEWTALTEENCCNAAVAVTQKEGEIIVAGFSQAVAKAFEELFNFVDENTQVQKVIGGKPTVVLMYIEKERASVLDDLKNKGVKIDFSKVISLSGPRREVLKGTTLIEQMLSGLHYKRVVINEPGARSYFKERERFFAASVKHECNCLIRLEEQPEEYLEEQQAHTNVGRRYTQMTVQGVLIAVYKANLCTHHVDVVVNASNEDLKHIGGLAGALLQAAGPELQAECDEVVRKNGRLQAGCAVITGAGKLPCKQVIHAVGPRWKEQDAGKCMHLLKKTIKMSLQLAETYNHHSIAFPSVSGGIFGFPLHKCVNAIVSAIKKTLEEFNGKSNLKEIHLVDIIEDNVQAFIKALKEVFSDDVPLNDPVQSLNIQTNIVHQPSKRTASQSSMNFALVTTEEGLDIMLKKGSIEDVTTDGVVISVGGDLQLEKGQLAKALLSKAGPRLQADLHDEGLGKSHGEGSVFTTKGYSLSCSYVFHAVAPSWSEGSESAVKILGRIVTKCLHSAEELSLKSITFPAIGTGILGFPGSVVAKLLFDTVYEFSNKKKTNSLREVHFLLHPKDVNNLQAFSNEFERRCGNDVDEASEGTAFFGPILNPAQDVYEMTIGSIKFQVAAGDITKETGDVIVNISNKSFNLKTGVSKAILEGAGKEVEDECAELALKPNDGYITTKAGSLPCKKIIHFVAQDDVKVPVSKVLRECELQQCTSVTFPAIGTGQAGRFPDTVADEMMDAITDFARSNSTPSVKTIKIVIFQSYLLNVFHTSMKKRENPGKTKSKSFLSRMASFLIPEKHPPKEKRKAVLENKVDRAVVQICGENEKQVEEAETLLKSTILKEQFQREIKDDSILDFDEAENEELRDLQKRLNIALFLGDNFIRITGFSKDVWFAYSTIQDMIHRVKTAKYEAIKAELYQNLIEWKYLEKDSYVSFDSMTNMCLENAFIRKQKDVSVVINKKKYMVNIESRYATDEEGKRVTLTRTDKSADQESTALPEKWDDMQNQQLKIVKLTPDTKDYKEVKERFLKTTPSLNLKIEKIERVQNPSLWKVYQIKKCQMDAKNGNNNNEKFLFHGTRAESLTFINNYGFNRSYAGMHAAQYGNGTYFAVNASYSANDTYSKPDANGKKHMYLARVLVGQYSQGTQGAITPAAKSVGNSVDLFDSSTDNVNNPSMFIVFNDIQAYPEYLITFTR